MQERPGDGGDERIRQRLGMARAGSRQAESGQDWQCRGAPDQGREAAVGYRRMGTRLLPGLSEPSRGLRECRARQTRACSHYSQPIGDERKVDEGDEHEVELLEPGEDTSEALESTEQPFDLIAPFVHFPVVFPRRDSSLLGWDDGDKSEIKRQLPRLVPLICTVHDEMERPRRLAELA